MGQANTASIVTHCGTGTAAQICDTLNLNGYNDWYLPSINELNKLYQNSAAIGGFVFNHDYWSSYEYNSDDAWSLFFGNGVDYHTQKSSTEIHVRAVRAF